MEIAAEPEEREALARRFGLVAIHSLSAKAALSRDGEALIAEGRLKAEVVQSCVASAAPLEASLDEPFRIEFRPEPTADAPDEEVELSESEMDVVFYEGASIDLGEAVAETSRSASIPAPGAGRRRGAESGGSEGRGRSGAIRGAGGLEG